MVTDNRSHVQRASVAEEVGDVEGQYGEVLPVSASGQGHSILCLIDRYCYVA